MNEWTSETNREHTRSDQSQDQTIAQKRVAEFVSPFTGAGRRRMFVVTYTAARLQLANLHRARGVSSLQVARSAGAGQCSVTP